MKKQQKLHVKIGDKIKIIAGGQKGLIGTISSISKAKSVAIINGVLPRIKYRKQNPNSEAQKVELEIPIHTSNLMLWDEQNNQASRIGYKLTENIKNRYFKKSGNILK
jgi:large subunit ribosomal protein L24|tara:strand:- start:964 stop:1287 length:324 start_codon:yes stop_codon:yes gene_type:complete